MSAEHAANPARKPNRWLAGALLGMTVTGWGYFVALGVAQATNPNAAPQTTEADTVERSEPQTMEIHRAGVLLICAELGGAALGALGGGLMAYVEGKRTAPATGEGAA
ncbi:hypothetical protein EYC59_06565 [Candidatus Saccharibacteria bacterium]|nr:MAG: hypothetical protein EYC59_06565 [Candidatus Saccharibacteria bacterium]